MGMEPVYPADSNHNACDDRGMRPVQVGKAREGGGCHVWTTRVQQAVRLHVHKTHERSHAAHISNGAQHSKTQYMHAQQSTVVTPGRRQTS
jgi:hypothetical protein